MESILELLIAGVALQIYGNRESPRHPALRHTVRAIALGGSTLILTSLTGLWEPPEALSRNLLGAAMAVWFLCFLIVIMAEHEADTGSTPVMVASLLFFPLLILVLIMR